MKDSVSDIILRYGNVSIPAAICPKCGAESFVEDGPWGDRVSACCGVAVADGPKSSRQVSGPRFKRKKPPLAVQRRLLEEQGGKCLYCENPFGTGVEVRGRLRHLAAVWDHFVPYGYSANNGGENFVAACQLCNGLKSSRVFEHIEDARAFVLREWSRKGYRVL